MKNEEAKTLLKLEISDCRSEKAKEIINTLLTLGCPVSLCEMAANFIANQFKSSHLVWSGIAALAGYALATTHEPLNFTYSRSEYLNFLKMVKKDMKTNPDRYQEVKVVDFTKVLRKEFDSKKNS